MTREQAINDILNGISYLIISHSTSAAREQYIPSQTPDESDDWIKEHKEYVEGLRKIRTEFEDLVTGLIND